ncbi:DUF3397 domain-containing protein [Bacillus spongiae]|uniref:DUF3397 domain-containing protein n=1 Tax=Bacillus spongiae TaxID=2683610 RepID=A0ABU8H9T7_9BACI
MANVLSSIGAVFVTIPLVGYFIVFIIVKQLSKQHRLAVSFAIDITTLLLLFAVHFIILTIWEQSFFWLIFLFMLIMGVGFILLYWKVKGEIIYSKIIKGFWRMNFLVLSFAYVTLLLFGLIYRLLTTI